MPVKRPWRAHYTRDWRTDPFVRGLNLEARCVYHELLDIAWDEGGLRTEWLESGLYVAQQIGITRRKFVSIWPRIRDKFEEFSPGIWSNSRLESERLAADSFSEKQANNAKLKHLKSARPLPAGRGLALPSQSHTQSQSQSQEDPPANSAGEAPKQPSDLPPLLKLYADSWVETFRPTDGKPPKLTKGDIKAALDLLKRHGLADASSLVLRFLADGDKFIAGRGHVLRDIQQRVNGYRASGGTQRTFRNFQQPRPPAETGGVEEDF